MFMSTFKTARKDTMSELLVRLQQQFPTLSFLSEQPLAPYTTVKIGGPAEVFCQITNSKDFVAVVQFMRKNQLPLTILGWGANTLIADRGLRGLVIRNMAQGITILRDTVEHESQVIPTIDPLWHSDKKKGSFTYEFSDLDYIENDAEPVLVELDSGVSLPFAINSLIDQGITGLQWFARIPATVGGAIYNNIHGGTHFISEVIQSVTVLTTDGTLRTLSLEELEFGYDTSRFHHSKEIIISALFKLYIGNAERARQTAEEWARRKAVQPQRSLGCIFQNITIADKERLNLPTTSAGYIIDHILHKKGMIKNNLKISEQHAAFIENLGGATAEQYLQIIREIITETRTALDITLRPEIFFLGFTDDELVGITNVL